MPQVLTAGLRLPLLLLRDVAANKARPVCDPELLPPPVARALRDMVRQLPPLTVPPPLVAPTPPDPTRPDLGPVTPKGVTVVEEDLGPTGLSRPDLEPVELRLEALERRVSVHIIPGELK